MPPYLLFSLGTLTGLGLALLAPSLARTGRPLAKEAIRMAMLAAHEATVRAAELAESVEDLYAEARAEAQAAPAAAAAEAEAREAVARARAAAARARKRGVRKAAPRKSGAPRDTE
jgi:DNA invertase Pin-like site-specific DNA recombinase